MDSSRPESDQEANDIRPRRSDQEQHRKRAESEPEVNLIRTIRLGDVRRRLTRSEGSDGQTLMPTLPCLNQTLI